MKRIARIKRHRSLRRYLLGTSERPRLAVFRSSQHIYVALVDDSKGTTLVAASDLKMENGTKCEKAFQVGKLVAQAALKKSIKTVVFDRGGFLYHGRVKALADGAREGGLKF